MEVSRKANTEGITDDRMKSLPRMGKVRPFVSLNPGGPEIGLHFPKVTIYEFVLLVISETLIEL